MDASKAKKAKSKAKARSSARASSQSQQAALHNQMLMQQAAMQSGGLNPEVQVPVAAMQDVTQAVNPYGRMGTVAPNLYNPGNVVVNY
jgi:hypothetical protein